MDADVGLVVESDLVAEAELDLGHDGAYGQRVQRAAHHLRAALEGPVVGHGDDLVGKERVESVLISAQGVIHI